MSQSLPETMTAAVLVGHGGYDKLVVVDDFPVPGPGPGELVARVAACGINNTDINTRIGWYSDAVAGDSSSRAADGYAQIEDDADAGWGGTLSFPRIQGADMVGHVVAVGDGVSEKWLGTRVMYDPWQRDWSDPMNRNKSGYFGSEMDGGFAQYVLLKERNTHRVNSEWSDAELATLACAYSTAENMLTRARVGSHDSVLITGASGGVGSALVQLAKRRGATVIALTTAAKAADILELGADAVIRRGEDQWQEVIKATTGTDKVSVAADVVGGPVFDKLLAVLARGGRYVTAGAIGGKQVTLDISHLYLNDWELIGATITMPEIFSNLIGYVERGEIRPVLARTYPISEIHQAQKDFLAKKHVGNLVIIP